MYQNTLHYPRVGSGRVGQYSALNLPHPTRPDPRVAAGTRYSTASLIVKKHILLTLKKINIRLNNIERNTMKIIIILISYAIAMKMNAQREIDAMTMTIITLYNNINQQKQLKKIKKEKTLIFKIKKQKEKNNLRTLFVKKLIERLQRVEKIKENMRTTKRFFNENVKMIIHSKKIKNRLIINNFLMKNVALSIYAISRIFEILIYEILHSSLRIARII